MIPHALTIVVNELNRHLEVYGPVATPMVELGNIAEGFKSGGGGNGVSRDVLTVSVVNIKEEKTLKNVGHYVRDDVALRARYENPPVFLNLMILIVATHASYTSALLMLSRAIRYFQLTNSFTQDTVDPGSLSTGAPVNALDRLTAFRLVFDLYSPTMEEVNHLWGTLGGKQYPFVLYMMRMLELKFAHVQSETGLITEIVGHAVPKAPVEG